MSIEFKNEPVALNDGSHNAFMSCLHERYLVHVVSAEYVIYEDKTYVKDGFTLYVYDNQLVETEGEIIDYRDVAAFANSADEKSLIACEVFPDKESVMKRVSQIFCELERYRDLS